jgi:L-asparaginase
VEAIVGPARITVFSLGGTITMSPGADRGGAVVPELGGRQLLASVPGLDKTDISVEVCDVLKVPGASLTIDDVISLGRQVTQSAEGGTAGFVVTQGTDTIEETAFLLELVYAGEPPVVVTGVMRNPAAPGHDGRHREGIQAYGNPHIATTVNRIINNQ